MARPIDEFVMAWDALSGVSCEEGWRTILVAPAGSCVLMAGRRFPGNEEALLACFSSAKIPVAERLPEGRGFEVSRADPHGDGKTWIALSRRESGSLELFAEMVGDVTGAMDVEAPFGEERALMALLRRVRMWQQFMGKSTLPLGPEAELGLVGELSFLAALLDGGILDETALESWVGPYDAPQDFVIGEGAVEVKATLATEGFPAKIGSLEQLDDSILSPLFLAAFRFARDGGGVTLPELVTDLETRLSGNPCAVAFLHERTFAAGYHDSHAPLYVRRFACKETRIYAVVDCFPRLMRGSVPDGVAKAVYEIDLSRVSNFETEFGAALKKLGAL